ncbi:uncharacterized protein LOC126656863 [Mercurialis annua]|uniref:uncharacterized protein LOC126656863 n=1 Tax=Mercurialis annua TaxID=3986 RepID=UPI0021600D00|nr:uncharacterized protein LOC126656863 [Mercurialis annua]
MADEEGNPLGLNNEGDNRVIPHNLQNQQDLQGQNNNRQRQPTLMEFFQSNVGNTTHGYFAHPVRANHYEIKTNIIQLLEARCQFYGLPNEDPNAHLSNFLEVCSTFKLSNMTEDEVWLRLFPFSLRDKAKIWIHALPRVGINRWSDLAKAFLNKYFPMAKTAKLTRYIMLYQQLDGESVSDAWERYKELQRKVPHHHITGQNLIQNFYNGSNDQTRSIIDTAAGGSLMRKTTDAALELLDEVAVNSCSWPTERAKAPAQRGVIAVATDPIVETVKSLLQEFLTKQVVAPNTHSVSAIQSNCEVCGVPSHMANECYVVSRQFNEQINYVGGQRPGNNPYAATHNPGWRNHPNFSWKDNGNHIHNQAGPSFQGEQRSQQNQGNFHHQNSRPQHPPGF